MKHVEIKSFNGIGDLLFVTPTLRVIKESYPDSTITVNTNYPQLLSGNPFVDNVGVVNRGIFLGYPDPIHAVNPKQHHILSDYEIVTVTAGLETPKPRLLPELYINLDGVPKTKFIGVQVTHKGHWHKKKVWPNFTRLVNLGAPFRAIEQSKNIVGLVRQLASYRAIICAEGGMSHIAKALGVPAIVIYGGFANPAWNGYADQINLCNEKSCSYCYSSAPCNHPVDERICLKEITVQQVLNAVKGLSVIKHLTDGNRAKEIYDDADMWCKGRGLDIGGGKNPYPRAAKNVDLSLGGDAHDLGEPEHSLDFIFSSHCLEHIEDYESVLRECRRVLKRSTGLLFLYLPHPDYHPWRPEHNSWHKHMLFPEKIIASLKKCGFGIMEVGQKNEHQSYKIVAKVKI